MTTLLSGCILGLLLVLLTTLIASGQPAAQAPVGSGAGEIRWPIPAGEDWKITNGYGWHGAGANELAGFDLQLKDDAQGTLTRAIVSPAKGEVTFVVTTSQDYHQGFAIRLDGFEQTIGGETYYLFAKYWHIKPTVKAKDLIEAAGQVISGGVWTHPQGNHVHYNLFYSKSLLGGTTNAERIPAWCENCPATVVDTNGNYVQAQWTPPKDCVVGNNAGCNNAFEGYVIRIDDKNHPPNADFDIQWSQTQPPEGRYWANVGESVPFDGSTSSDPDSPVGNPLADIKTWSWDFGDGTKLAQDGPNVSHAYSTTGQYIVKLTVTDRSGLSNTKVLDRPISVVEVGSGIRNIDTTLIIDCTGSMTWNDPAYLRKQAAKVFLDQLQYGDSASVLCFNQAASVLHPQLRIGSQSDREALKAAVDRVSSNGGTNLGLGLEAGYNQLSAGSTDRRAAVFLTDGIQDCGSSCPYNNQHRLYAGKGWRVYTVGLGSGQDASLLRRIASETQGRYYDSPEAGNLQLIYIDLVQQVTGQTSIWDQVVQFVIGTVEEIQLPVFRVPQITFSASWPGSPTGQAMIITGADGVPTLLEPQEVSLTLIDPNGIPVDLNDPSVYHAKSSTYELYRINNPVPGDWQVQMNAAGTPGASIPISLKVAVADVIAPSGDLAPAIGTFTNQTGVLVNLEGEDIGHESSDLSVRLRNEGTAWQSWQPFSKQIDWVLPDEQGVKNVYVQIRDQAGNLSHEYVTNFILDTEPPSTQITSVPQSPVTTFPIALSWQAQDNWLMGDSDLDASLKLVGYDCRARDVVAARGIEYPALPSGTYTFTVRSIDYAGNVEPLPASSAFTVENSAGVNVPLQSGWNLVSFPLELTDPDPRSVLSGLTGVYDVVLGYLPDPVSFYPNLDDMFNTLKLVDPLHGYWIKAQEACPAVVAGARVSTGTPLELKSGWNMISYLPEASMAVTEALTTINGKYSAVMGYEGGALNYYPSLDPFMNSLKTMKPGMGYWIRMDTEGILLYPDATATAALATIPQSNAPQVADDVHASNEWINIYSVSSFVDGRPVELGSVISAYNSSGVKIGETAVQKLGQFGVLSIYADDPFTPKVDGAVRGEEIQFRIDDREAVVVDDMPVTWTANGDLMRVDLVVGASPSMTSSVYLPMIFGPEHNR